MFSGRWRVISARTDREKPLWSSRSYRCQVRSGWILRSRGGGKWSAATFSFCFARWCQAGTVLEIPPPPLPSWPPRRRFSYISWKFKKKNKKNKEPLWSSVVNKLHHVCCAPRVDIMSCSGSDLTTERGTRTQVKKKKKITKKTQKKQNKIKCQQSLVLIKHPAPTDSALDGGAARGGTGCNWKMSKTKSNKLRCSHARLIKRMNGFHR